MEKYIRKIKIKKFARRLSCVLGYGAVVFNMAFSKFFWSLPLVFCIYTVYSLAFFEYRDVDEKRGWVEFTLLLIFDITFIGFISVLVFNVFMEYLPLVCLISLGTEMIICRFPLNVPFRKKADIKKIRVCLSSSLILIIGIVVKVIRHPSETDCVITAVALLLFATLILFYLLPMSRDIRVYFKKYFNGEKC